MKTVLIAMTIGVMTTIGATAQNKQPNNPPVTEISTPDRINPFKWDFLNDKPIKDQGKTKALFHRGHTVKPKPKAVPKK